MAEQNTVKPHTSKHSIMKTLVQFVVFVLYRSLEIAGPIDSTRRGPVLGVVTHFGGLADGLVVVDSSSRWPRLMAKDVIFQIPVIGWLASYFGGIPVHQPKKGASKEERREFALKMFSSAHAALEQPSYVVIFPEGVTREEPSMAPVRTGAARIVLGARADGTTNITVLPQAIHYGDRATLRSRVFLNVGEPIVLDDWVSDNVPAGESQGPDNHEAVTNLTTEIEERMRAIAPDYSNWREQHLLTLAAETSLRDETPDHIEVIDYADRERVAGALNRDSTEEQKERVLEAASSYDKQLQALGLGDLGLELRAAKPGRLWRFLVGSLLKMLLVLPFAFLGVLINWIPAILTYLSGWIPASDPVKATLRPAIAVLTFGATWLLLVWSGIELDLVSDAGWIALCVIGLPLTLVALIWESEQVVLVKRALFAWRRARRPEDVMQAVLDARKETVAAVQATGVA